jgi:hypothetical protein
VEVRTITDYLKQDPEWAKILSMDKNEVLLFIAERLETITMMAQGRYSGKITREEQKLYQEAWSYIDPKAKVCFTCGRSPQLMSAALLNFYQLPARQYGKWRWGNGNCIYDSKKEAEKAHIEIKRRLDEAKREP